MTLFLFQKVRFTNETGFPAGLLSFLLCLYYCCIENNQLNNSQIDVKYVPSR